LVGCSLGSQPAQNCEGLSAVVVVAYHKPIKHLNRLAIEHDNQTMHSMDNRMSAASGTNNN